jgi:hypothetical protein
LLGYCVGAVAMVILGFTLLFNCYMELSMENGMRPHTRYQIQGTWYNSLKIPQNKATSCLFHDPSISTMSRHLNMAQDIRETLRHRL